MTYRKRIAALAVGLVALTAPTQKATAEDGGCWRTEVCHQWGYSCTGTDCSFGPLCCKGVCAQT